MRRHATVPLSPRGVRLVVHLALLAVIAQLLLVVPVAQAGPVYPAPVATPVAWPSTFTSYTTDTGTAISDVEGESGVGSVYDISSKSGGATSVFLALTKTVTVHALPETSTVGASAGDANTDQPTPVGDRSLGLVLVWMGGLLVGSVLVPTLRRRRRDRLV